MSGNEPPWDDYKAMRSKGNLYIIICATRKK